MKWLLCALAFTLSTLSGFCGDKITSIHWNGKDIKEISDVQVSASGQITIMHSGGIFTTTADKLPANFLDSWRIKKVAAPKTQPDDIEEALRAGLFREVDGTVYDLRKPQPDWTLFHNVTVLQVLNEGVLIDYSYSLRTIFVRNLPNTLADDDFLPLLRAKLTGTFTYINKLGDTRTVRQYDVGKICTRDQIPESMTKQNAPYAKVAFSKESKIILNQLPESEELSASGTGFSLARMVT